MLANTCIYAGFKLHFAIAKLEIFLCVALFLYSTALSAKY